MKESFIGLSKTIIFIGQILWFLRIKNRVSKFMRSSYEALIPYIPYIPCYYEAVIPCNEQQFLDWPSIAAHSSAGLICIAYGLVILVHRNIQVTTVTIGFIQLRQGFEC